MKAFSTFERLCRNRFKVLEACFGFRITNVEKESYGVFVTYQNPTSFLRASFEPREGGIHVLIGRLVDGEIPPYEDSAPNWFDFRDLVALRAPEAAWNTDEWPSGAKIDEALKTIANALKAHAADVLRGDFQIFEELARIVKARASQMKNE